MEDYMRRIMARHTKISAEEEVLAPVKYEYLDERSDIELHAWGDNQKEAFEQCGVAMHGLMFDFSYIAMEDVHVLEVEAEDTMKLFYQFLINLLFLVNHEPKLACIKLSITEFETVSPHCRLVCKCYGAKADPMELPQSIPAYALIYSTMRIKHDTVDNKYHINVIIDGYLNHSHDPDLVPVDSPHV